MEPRTPSRGNKSCLSAVVGNGDCVLRVKSPSSRVETMSFSLPSSVVPVREADNQIGGTLHTSGHQGSRFSVLGPDNWHALINSDRTSSIGFMGKGSILVRWRASIGPDETTRASSPGELLACARNAKMGLYQLAVDKAVADTGVTKFQADRLESFVVLRSRRALSRRKIRSLISELA